jgi:hypothetical protein
VSNEQDIAAVLGEIVTLIDTYIKPNNADVSDALFDEMLVLSYTDVRTWVAYVQCSPITSVTVEDHDMLTAARKVYSEAADYCKARGWIREQ